MMKLPRISLTKDLLLYDMLLSPRDIKRNSNAIKTEKVKNEFELKKKGVEKVTPSKTVPKEPKS